MRSLSTLAIATLSLFVPSAHAQEFTTPVSPGFSPCPQPVGVQNGGFESGSISPWAVEAGLSDPVPPSGSITSPGYQSKYAWEVSFPPGVGIGWSTAQDIGQLCEGVAYDVTFAVNLVGFALQGEPDNRWNFCNIAVSPNYCYEKYSSPGYYNASTEPGWVRYSYTCRSQKTGVGELLVNFDCRTNYTLPAMTLRIDDLSVELAGNQKASETSAATPVPVTTSPGGVESSSGGSLTAMPGTTTVPAGYSGTASGSGTGATAGTLPSGDAPVPTIATAAAGLARGGDYLEDSLRSCLVLWLFLGSMLLVRW